MVEIQSKEVIDKISDELKVQPALEIPRTLAKDIQLVYGINPPREIKLISTAVSDGSATIHTTHATKRTFITGAYVSTSKDVLAPSLATSLTLFPLGMSTAQNLLVLRYEPLTVASHLVASKDYVEPIELAKASAITLTHTSATGSIDTAVILTFYETDPQ